MKFLNSLSQVLNSIQSSHSEHIVIQNLLYHVKTVISWHFSILSSVGCRVINAHVDPTINIGLWVLKYASITSGMFLSVGLSQIGIPKAWNYLGFIKVFFILFPNHNPLPNISIMNSPDSIVYDVAPVHIGIFNWSEYSAKKSATMHSSGVNDIGCIFLPIVFYLHGYPSLLRMRPNGFDPVFLKAYQ